MQARYLSDNLVYTTYSPSVTFAIASGPTNAAITAGQVTQLAVAGNATFSGLTVAPYGSYTFRATATGFLPTPTTASIFCAVTATKLVFSQAPATSQGFGNPFTQQPVVWFVNAQDVLDPARVGDVALSFKPGTNPQLAVLSPAGAGGVVKVTSVGGVATFTGLTVDKSGTFTLVATSTTIAGIASAEVTFTVPVVATKLVFRVAPASTAAPNVALTTQPQVAFYDAADSLDASRTLLVSLDFKAGAYGRACARATESANVCVCACVRTDRASLSLSPSMSILLTIARFLFFFFF